MSTANRIVDRATTLTGIARQHLDIETLATRNSDRLDFHEHAVWAVRAALEAAYEAGRAAGLSHAVGIMTGDAGTPPAFLRRQAE